MRLWDFALAAWAKPGVEAACLKLQDDHGQCVSLLLWRAWAVAEGRPAQPMGRAVDLAHAWENEIIAPLRAARRAPLGSADPAAARDAARAAELAAERRLLEALEALTPTPAGADGKLGEALAALAHAWNGRRPGAAIMALASALER